MIKLTREFALMDRKRSYKIIIDNIEYDRIKPDETKELNVSPGHHTIYIKIDWCRSNKIHFYVSSSNEINQFKCGNSIKGWKTFFLLFYVYVLINKYLYIKEIIK